MKLTKLLGYNARLSGRAYRRRATPVILRALRRARHAYLLHPTLGKFAPINLNRDFPMPRVRFWEHFI